MQQSCNATSHFVDFKMGPLSTRINKKGVAMTLHMNTAGYVLAGRPQCMHAYGTDDAGTLL